MSEIVQWYQEIPPITRHWFGLSVLFPILGEFRSGDSKRNLTVSLLLRIRAKCELLSFRSCWAAIAVHLHPFARFFVQITGERRTMVVSDFKFKSDDRKLIYQNFPHQIWRPLTALFYYPITPQTGIHYLMNLYFLYNYSKQLETSESKKGNDQRLRRESNPFCP